MPNDYSARIEKAKALAQALGLPEQEVIKLALEEASGDPRLMREAQRKLSDLQGFEGITSLDVPRPTRTPTRDLPGFSSGPVQFQASGVEDSQPTYSGSTVVPPPDPLPAEKVNLRRPSRRKPFFGFDWFE